ncbi:MAG: NAD(P)/FAD-dependent oxidoreductase [Hydrogenophilus sp.]|nr:NAD(P)/FAD-dependent oxidoreductase [Hydrogenophilus sp.]
MTPALILIVGAGPAGLSAALWLHHLGLTPLLIDKEPVAGGMMRFNTLPNDWILGHPDVTGLELAQRFLHHLSLRAIPIHTSTSLQSLEPTLEGYRVTFRTATPSPLPPETTVAAILLVTGTRPRGFDALSPLPGLEQLSPDYFAVGPEAFHHLSAQSGRRILIIGGGDNAFENALLLLAHGAQPTLVMRRTPRAQAHLQAKLLQAVAAGRAFLYPHTRLLRLNHNPTTASLLTPTGLIEQPFDRLHLLIGYQPDHTALMAFPPPLRQQIALDPDGYLIVDPDGRTPLPRCYAAGDLVNPTFPSVLSAIAGGARAAKAIERDLRSPHPGV